MLETYPHARFVAACIVPLCWMTVSSGLIILNKTLMIDIGFRYPVTLSGMGQAFSALAAFLVCRVLRWVPADKAVTPAFFAKRILPVGFCMAATLMLGNTVYMFLSVAFIQMLKAFTPVITMLGLFLASLESPTAPLIGSVVIIAGGTALAGYGTLNASIVGMLIQLASESAEAVRLVMTQTLLQGLSFHPIEGMLYLAPASVVWMAIGAAALEVRPMLASGDVAIVAAHPHLFLAAASMGFLVTTLAFFTIQLCGSLTLKVLGTVKNAALVIFCVIFLREHVTGLQGTGYTIALLGFSWYQWIKTVAPPTKLPAPTATGKAAGAKAGVSPALANAGAHGHGGPFGLAAKNGGTGNRRSMPGQL